MLATSSSRCVPDVQAPLAVGVAVGVAGPVLVAVAVLVAAWVTVGSGPLELELLLHVFIVSNKTAGRKPSRGANRRCLTCVSL